MSLRNRVVSLWPWRKRQADGKGSDEAPSPLREFVYLDEVSLRSLLASQTGAVTEQVSSAISQAEEAEIAGALSVNSGVLKSEVNPRYQTSNSRSIQTSRKAIIQSLFKEFRELGAVELLLATDTGRRFLDLDELLGAGSSVCVSSDTITRGSLIEVEVELDVDPVFKLSTLISETSDMAEDYPEMFAAAGTGNVIEAAAPINKVLQRLLTGLIPIRARAVNLSVVRVGPDEYIVHDAALPEGMEADTRPLEIVGVTEHLGYWKDIRRVLFSGARFTMLCRVARDGIQESWTPVKLADVFKDVAPDLAAQIGEAGRTGFNVPTTTVQERQHEAMGRALEGYVESHLARSTKELAAADRSEIDDLIGNLKSLADTASGQRRAFATLGQHLSKDLDVVFSSAELLQLRRDARSAAGLELFPSAEPSTSTAANTEVDDDLTRDALLDTEVIAIYW